MIVETFFADFGCLADAPNGVKKLRELILQPGRAKGDDGQKGT